MNSSRVCDSLLSIPEATHARSKLHTQIMSWICSVVCAWSFTWSNFSHCAYCQWLVSREICHGSQVASVLPHSGLRSRLCCALALTLQASLSLFMQLSTRMFNFREIIYALICKQANIHMHMHNVVRQVGARSGSPPITHKLKKKYLWHFRSG